MTRTKQELEKPEPITCISPFREDEKTCGTPAWVWSVVVDDGLFVRAHNETNSRWYKSAMRQSRPNHRCGHDERKSL